MLHNENSAANRETAFNSMSYGMGQRKSINIALTIKLHCRFRRYKRQSRWKQLMQGNLINGIHVHMSIQRPAVIQKFYRVQGNRV